MRKASLLLAAVFVAASRPLPAQISLRAVPLDRSLGAVPTRPTATPIPRPTPPPTLSPSDVVVIDSLSRVAQLYGFQGVDREALTGQVQRDRAAQALMNSYRLGYNAGVAAAGSTSNSDGTTETIRPVLTAGWEQAVVQGLTSLVVSNAKASTLAAASDVLRQDLCGGHVASAQLKPSQLLVSTCTMAISSNSTTIPVAWTTYKAAFEQDLTHLPDRMLTQLARTDQPEFRQTLLTGIALVRQIERGDDPVLMLGSLASYVPEDGVPGSPCQKRDSTVDRVCVGVRSVGTAVNVLGPLLNSRDPRATVQQLMNDPTYRERVLNNYRDGIRRMNIHAHWEPTQDEKDRLQLAFQRLAYLLAEVQTLGEAAKQEPAGNAVSDRPNARTFNRYVDVTVRLLGLMPELLPQAQFTRSEALRTALDVTDRTSAVLAHVRNREYADAFVAINQIVTDSALSTYFTQVVLPDWYTSYAPIVAEVATAQTPEAFQSALSAAVAPMGSYRAKREPRWFFGVNAYVGVQGGREELSGLGDVGDDADFGASQFGLTVPVGVELGRGGIGPFSLSIFGSVLDLGNVARFRIGEDDDSADVAEEPKYGFAQLLSPGAYAVVGLGKRLPISVGGGVSWTPSLRDVQVGANDDRKADTLRWGLFIGVDVPLFTF